MKPIAKLTIFSRDPMDPDTLTKCGVVEFETIGEGQIILTRDEMGGIHIESAEIKADPIFTDQLNETCTTLAQLHEQLGKVHIAANHALTDMFAVHKLLTR